MKETPTSGIPEWLVAYVHDVEHGEEVEEHPEDLVVRNQYTKTSW
jgi:hypothetical protein